MGASVAVAPVDLELELRPRSRYDAIDVNGAVRAHFGDVLAPFSRVTYCSLHTTAGFLDQGLTARLGNRRERLDPFIRAFQRLFPAEAGYRHDRLEERDELSEEQRRVEPRNADSHLAFIASGLRSCVTYVRRPGEPVYFMDLDGVSGDVVRRRNARVLGFNEARVVARERLVVQVSGHPIDSLNLADPRVGVLPLGEALARRHGVARGRLDIALDSRERDAGITVNEYETLLMRHDLAEVLADPLRFLARQGRRILRDPRAIAAKSLGYARYDLVQVLNELLDALRVSESALERLLARLMAVPASRFLRLKRSASLLVAGRPGGGPTIVRGAYQSPILIQWNVAPERTRALEVTLTELR